MSKPHTQGLANVHYSEVMRRLGMATVTIGDVQLVGPLSIADARRLAACWNACAGIETENLERFPGWVHDGFAPGAEIMKELDVLRAALSEPVAWMHPDEIAGLAKYAESARWERVYGRIYARQHHANMVRVFAAKSDVAAAKKDGA